MSAVLDVVAAALILTGAVIAVIAAYGLHRLPDVYARMHVATKPATLGVVLCLGGAALRADGASTATKLVLAILFQLVTTPVAGHLLGRAAHASRACVSEHTVLDELRPSDEPRPSDELRSSTAWRDRSESAGGIEPGATRTDRLGGPT